MTLVQRGETLSKGAGGRYDGSVEKPTDGRTRYWSNGLRERLGRASARMDAARAANCIRTRLPNTQYRRHNCWLSVSPSVGGREDRQMGATELKSDNQVFQGFPPGRRPETAAR